MQHIVTVAGAARRFARFLSFEQLGHIAQCALSSGSDSFLGGRELHVSGCGVGKLLPKASTFGTYWAHLRE